MGAMRPTCTAVSHVCGTDLGSCEVARGKTASTVEKRDQCGVSRWHRARARPEVAEEIGADVTGLEQLTIIGHNERRVGKRLQVQGSDW